MSLALGSVHLNELVRRATARVERSGQFPEESGSAVDGSVDCIAQQGVLHHPGKHGPADSELSISGYYLHSELVLCSHADLRECLLVVVNGEVYVRVADRGGLPFLVHAALTGVWIDTLGAFVERPVGKCIYSSTQPVQEYLNKKKFVSQVANDRGTYTTSIISP